MPEDNLVKTRNICLFIGMVFGVCIHFDIMYSIPCGILLLISGIHLLEFSVKQKKMFESYLQDKLISYEKLLSEIKKEQEKIKADVTKLNLSTVYGARKT